MVGKYESSSYLFIVTLIYNLTTLLYKPSDRTLS